MSANAQIVALFVVLVLAAAAIRAVVGPIPVQAGAQSLYAVNKAGSATGPSADEVEFAVSDAR